jgi:hypothetical protein
VRHGGVATVVGLGIVQFVRVAGIVLDGVVLGNEFAGSDAFLFSPWELTDGISALTRRPFSLSAFHQSHEGQYFYLEAIKWGTFLVIAVWLTIAQIRARSAKSGSTASP